MYLTFQRPHADSQRFHLRFQRTHVRGAGLGRKFPVESGPGGKIGERLTAIALEQARALGTSELRIYEYEFWADRF